MCEPDDDKNPVYCTRLVERYRITFAHPESSWKDGRPGSDGKRLKLKSEVYVSLDRVRNCVDPSTTEGDQGVAGGGWASREWKIFGARRSIARRVYRSEILQRLEFLAADAADAADAARMRLILSRAYGDGDDPARFSDDWALAWPCRELDVPAIKTPLGELVALVTTRRPFLRYYDFCDGLVELPVRAEEDAGEIAEEDSKEEKESAQQPPEDFSSPEKKAKLDGDALWERIDLGIKNSS